MPGPMPLGPMPLTDATRHESVSGTDAGGRVLEEGERLGALQMVR